jgi:ABC-type oligopeptide transport system substrate-binding subunit
MAAPPPARHRFRLFAALAAFALTAGLVGLAAQPPDEGGKGPAKKKKIVVDDPDGPAPKGAGTPPDVRLDELAAAADGAPAALKEVFARFAVPADRITLAMGGSLRVKPLPLHKSDRFPAEFGVVELDAAGRPAGEARTLTPAEVKLIEHYEESALAEADKLLKDTTSGGGVTPDARALAAEKLLAAALRFHDYAREKGLRRGKAWDPVRASLDARLKDARVRRLQRAVAAQDWPRALEAGNALTEAYPKDAAVAREVAVARVAAAEPLMRTGVHADKARARELLDNLEASFPGAGGDAVRKLRRDLAAEAVRLYDRAVAHKAAGNLADARADLDRAADLDPTVPGLRELQREIGSASPVLYVGVRQFPERLSPATARFDSERQVVELLFQGLLEELPDRAGGVTYRPAAAQAAPLVVPNGRDILIRQFPKGPADPDGFDTADVVATVKLLRGRPDAWVSAGLPWLEDLPNPSGGAAVRVNFRHGHPDPRALLTFKLLPGRWLTQRGKAADDSEFAARPFGTGPYRLRPGSADGAGGRQLHLEANPSYGRSRDRAKLPLIREITVFEVPRNYDLVAEFRAGRLHLLPDLTPAELDRVRKGERIEFGGKAQVVTAQTNRRVHILAVNHRRPPLQNKKLRQGLSLALDREAVVREVYRFAPAEHQKYGLGMTGPFPPLSWATPKNAAGVPVALYNRSLGVDRLQEYLRSPGAVGKFALAYPDDDPLAAAACRKLADQVAALGLATPDGQPFALTPTPLARGDLHRQVEEEGRYDLAYVPLEYPDDWYPFGLAAFLDPKAAGRGGRNWTGFGVLQNNPDKEDLELVADLTALVEHRDFEKELLPRARRLHDAFNQCVPFVPLWHLDRHMLVHAGLKVYLDDGPDPLTPKDLPLLNQSVLFQNVARWRLE